MRRPARLFAKHIWWRYRREAEQYMKTRGSLEEYAKMKARELYGTDDLDEAGRRLIREAAKKLPLYDEAKYGRLPQELIERARELGILS